MATAASGWIGSVLGGLADLVWPRTCALCDGAIDIPASGGCLCQPCLDAVRSDDSPACPRCTSTVGPHTDLSAGCPRCRGTTFNFSGAVRLGVYDGLLRQAVLRMKQEAGEVLAEELGRIFAQTRRAQLVSGNPEVVVPVPLHWRRRWERGYNQSEAVARELAQSLQLRLCADWLIRTRLTQYQTSLAPSNRWENVRGAFRIGTGVSVQKARVLLVDDVLTTGATTDAAAGTLIREGAAQVTVAIIAHR